MVRVLLLALAIFVPAVDLLAQTAANNAVTFSRRSAKLGDQAEQTIAVDFKLKTTARMGSEVLDEAEAHLHRDHQRVVTATELGPAGARGATVQYKQAERTINGGQANREPVAGKTYRCLREGEELQITTDAGEVPPLPEFEIVAKNMATLGLPNPLARYFDGRRVSVGEQIDLPIELAAELLGFEDKFASAKRFSMTLTDVKQIDGQTCAVFKTEIEAGSGGSGQLGLIVAGPMVMQVAGCRTVTADLSGPIGMSDIKVSAGRAVQTTGIGKMRIAIRTRYRDAH